MTHLLPTSPRKSSSFSLVFTIARGAVAILSLISPSRRCRCVCNACNLFCPGSKVSVGEWKLCHTMLLLESFITRLPLLRRVTVVPLPDDVLLSHTVDPLVSVRIRLPSRFSEILEPYLFTGE